MIRFKTQDP
ncbi:hypothetical protein N499_1287A, partial [Wolbachia pipientis wVitA]